MEGHLWKHESAGACHRDRGTGSSSPRRCPLVLLEVAINPTIEPVDPMGWDTSGQTTNREGAQSHLSTANWIKDLLNKALPTRERPSFPHHKSLSSGSLYKPLSLIHQRTDRSKKNYNPTAWLEQKPHYRKLIRIKNQRVMSQMKGQDKTQKQLKELEIDNLPPKEFRIMIVKMIQNLGKQWRRCKKCLLKA